MLIKIHNFGKSLKPIKPESAQSHSRFTKFILNNPTLSLFEFIILPYVNYEWSLHLSVHGHWLLAALLNRYPDSELAEQIVSVFDQQFQVGFAN